jgi:4'-phosphopantetheinyl transferase
MSEVPNWPDTPLKENEVRLWEGCVDLPKEGLENFFHFLNPEEQARANRFHSAVERAHCVAGRACLRLLLGHLLETGPLGVPLCSPEGGKPHLRPGAHPERLDFSVAHSHGRVVIGIGRGCAVGVDIEQMRSDVDVDQVAQGFFSATEMAELGTLPDPVSKRHGFFNCWTRKEAYSKAMGDGIGRGFDQFAVSLTPGEPARLIYDHRRCGPEPWSFYSWSPAADYVAAIAVSGEGRPLPFLHSNLSQMGEWLR